jgi:hypothetical protein
MLAHRGEGISSIFDGQVITATNAANVAAALRRLCKTKTDDPLWMASDRSKKMQDLILLLETGEVTIT